MPNYSVPPKAAIFDFGGTLFQDSPFNALWAADTLLACSDNPRGITRFELVSMWEALCAAVTARCVSADGFGIDVELSSMLRNICARTGLVPRLRGAELEYEFDRRDSERRLVPDADKLIDALHSAGAVTGVISNVVMSGEAMSRAIREWLPRAEMKFVFTSADFLFCKPCRDMFDAALTALEIPAENCWYFGDSYNCDVLGALGAGMGAVLIDRAAPSFSMCSCEKGAYIRVSSWSQLLDRIKAE